MAHAGPRIPDEPDHAQARAPRRARRPGGLCPTAARVGSAGRGLRGAGADAGRRRPDGDRLASLLARARPGADRADAVRPRRGRDRPGLHPPGTGARLRGGGAGRARALRLRRCVRALPARGSGRLRHDRVGGTAAVVQRRRGDLRPLLSRRGAVAGGGGASAVTEGDGAGHDLCDSGELLVLGRRVGWLVARLDLVEHRARPAPADRRGGAAHGRGGGGRVGARGARRQAAPPAPHASRLPGRRAMVLRVDAPPARRPMVGLGHPRGALSRCGRRGAEPVGLVRRALRPARRGHQLRRSGAGPVPGSLAVPSDPRPLDSRRGCGRPHAGGRSGFRPRGGDRLQRDRAALDGPPPEGGEPRGGYRRSAGLRDGGESLARGRRVADPWNHGRHAVPARTGSRRRGRRPATGAGRRDGRGERHPFRPGRSRQRPAPGRLRRARLPRAARPGRRRRVRDAAVRGDMGADRPGGGRAGGERDGAGLRPLGPAVRRGPGRDRVEPGEPRHRAASGELP